jgi:hypothetical protein
MTEVLFRKVCGAGIVKRDKEPALVGSQKELSVNVKGRPTGRYRGKWT